MTSDQVDQIHGAVCDEVASIAESASFREWRAESEPKGSDLVALNNSFLYRGSLTKTTKNDRYLCVSTNDLREPFVILSNSRINLKYKRISGRIASDYPKLDLREEIQRELERFGTIALSLVGAIGNDLPASVTLPDGTGFSEIRYMPSQEEFANVDDSVIKVSDLENIDSVWSSIEHSVRESYPELDISPLAKCFEDSLTQLREASGRPVDLERVSEDEPSILSEITSGIDDQVIAYRRALQAHKTDGNAANALNDVLRISYNFADGTQDLMALVVGLSDLKPLISWLTIGRQYALADRLEDLPFALVGDAKPSLEKYRSLISGARNRAFHDMFPFARPFRASLRSDAFRSATLHLFREFRRGSPALEFDDRELVELLQGFSRATERPVPARFWEMNQAVMEAVGEVTRGLQRALVLAAPPRT